MLKVLDIFPVGNMYSVTLEGACDNIRNGSRLIDNKGNVITVLSVAMTRYENPSDISTNTTVLVSDPHLQKGSELSIC